VQIPDIDTDRSKYDIRWCDLRSVSEGVAPNSLDAAA